VLDGAAVTVTVDAVFLAIVSVIVAVDALLLLSPP